jgi:hypothetical protein
MLKHWAIVRNSSGIKTPRTFASFPEQPHQQRQNHADDQTRDDWKIKTEVPFAVMDVARQSSEPTAADPGPKQQSYASYDEANDKQDFADIVH